MTSESLQTDSQPESISQSTMRSLLDLKSTYLAIAKQLNAPPELIRFDETPQHDGSPHIESDGIQFAYVTTERGDEYERKYTTNEDDILYWLVCELTGKMASRFELTHRILNQDSRRMLFEKHIELLGRVHPEWRNRLQSEYQAILAQHPFQDTVDGPKA